MLARLGQPPPAQQLPGGGAPGPAATPMATPQKKDGSREMARVKIHVAMNMLEAALPTFGAESKEGKALLKTLMALAKDFGENDASDLVPAEIASIFKSMPQMGGGSDVQQQIMKMMKGGGGAPGAGGMPGGGAKPMPMPMPQPG